VTFEVGDKVIYPNQGLGVVTRIEEKTILGTTCGFYHLRIVANETTVLVPLDNVDGVGLRRAIGDAEVERLFNALGNGKIDSHQNWKGRFKDNSDKMRTGSIYDVADVLKSLTLLSRSKSLSFREKRMLDRAKFLIISEISEVMRETAESIEGRVEKALERSFTTRSRERERDRFWQKAKLDDTSVLDFHQGAGDVISQYGFSQHKHSGCDNGYDSHIALQERDLTRNAW